MDPRLLKLLGITVQTPVDDPGDGGGGNRAVSDGPDDPEDPEDPEDDDDDDDDPEDPEDPENPEDSEDDDTEDDDSDDDEELGARAQKRINKLIAQRKDAEARVKTLEAQLADAKKLSGDDGKAIMKAAESSGILPGLMTKAEAEAFTEMDRYRAVIANYEQWLDNHDPDDELEIDNGKTMSYAKVERRVRKLQGELGDLKDEYGPRRKELLKKVREIFEAGVEALKAGKKPAEKKPKKTERKDESPKQKPTANSPKPKRGSEKNLEDMDVENDDDLEAYITAMRRKK
ncbi:MAG: hypothetical protein IKF72_14445 [Kiritimatiellae bacterium]|nr:hypothetical protein [Kiritimatiellia bacterium]